MKNLFFSTIHLVALATFTILVSITDLHAQNNNMGIGTATPDASAILELKSNDKGLLIPRPTAAPTSPATGLMYYSTGEKLFKYWDGSWRPIGLWSLNGANARYTAGNVETTGGFYINNDNPTIHLQDTDGRSGFIHQNANLMHFLSSASANANTWAINGSYWPLTLNMINDAATFGGPAYFMEGNVGIGTTAPGINKLRVVGPSNNGSGSNLISAECTGGGYDNAAVFGGNYTEDYVGYGGFFKGGWVGAYTTVPATGNNTYYGLLSEMPYSAGTSYAIRGQASGSGTNYAGHFLGNVTVTGTFSNPSDRRFKQGIESLTGALDKVNSLKIYSYYFKETGGMNFSTQKQMGFIADELEKVLPDLVVNEVNVIPDVNNKDASLRYDYKGVNYIGVIPLLAKAIQEQQQIIESQAKKLEAQQGEIEQLRTDNKAQQAEIEAIKTALAKAGIKLN